MIKHIILDTNMLMAVAQFRVDVKDELTRTCDFAYDLSILDGTKRELQHIEENQSGKNKAAAKLALQLIPHYKLKIIKTDSNQLVDNVLVDYSKKGYIVATQDVGLKRRLKRPYIVLRSKKQLVIVG